MITTFSDALREMDRNTEIYMVEQLAKEVQEKDHALAEKDNVIAEKDNALAEQARLIEQLKKQSLPKLVLQINIAKMFFFKRGNSQKYYNRFFLFIRGRCTELYGKILVK